jgi:RND family efflux transporter MFP subunit
MVGVDLETPQERLTMRRFYTGLVCMALAGCKTGGATEPEAQPPATPVEIGTVALATIRDTSDYIATLRSRRSVTLRPQVEGQVARILAHSGDAVHRGQLLMQIDPARQFHTVASTKASAASKEAALKYAEQAYDRVRNLFGSGAASQQELDQARSTFETCKADVETLGAQVREGEVQLHYFSIVAPEDGVVGDMPVREGDYVTPLSILTTVDQNGELEIYVSVPVERASALQVGMPIELTDDTGKVVGQSHVTFISPQVAEDTQSILVKASIENGAGLLRTSQFVRARVIWSQHRGPAVPTSAIKRFNGQSFVFAAVKKGSQLTAEQRPVTLGPVDGAQYPVLKGIAEGEGFVLSGLQKLHDGSPIAPRSATPGTKG